MAFGPLERQGRGHAEANELGLLHHREPRRVGAGGGIGGAVSGAMGAVNMVSGIVGAVSGVIGNRGQLGDFGIRFDS